MTALVESVAGSWAVESPSFRRSAAWLRTSVSLLAAIAILAIALPAAFGGAAGASGSDPVEVFSSGPLIAVESGAGGDLSMAGMVPGQSRSATIRVSNAGSAAAAFSLAARFADTVGPNGARLSSAMTLRVLPVGTAGKPLYTGSLAGMSRLDLGSIPAGAERAYRFTVTLPRDVGNEIAGSSLSAGFVWNAA